MRLDLSKPVMYVFLTWDCIAETCALKRDWYCVKLWLDIEELIECCLSERGLEISNHRFGTVVISLIETVKENGLNPFAYLVHISKCNVLEYRQCPRLTRTISFCYRTELCPYSNRSIPFCMNVIFISMFAVAQSILILNELKRLDGVTEFQPALSYSLADFMMVQSMDDVRFTLTTVQRFYRNPRVARYPQTIKAGGRPCVTFP